MNIFVDVGAHVGESLAVALDGSWRFDHVHSFEPDPACIREMQTRFAPFIADGRLTLHAVALGGAEGEVVLSGDNAGGAASVLKDFIADDARRISVPMIDVNAFLDREIPDGARLYIKMNCEGGEVAILERLAERADVSNIASIMVDFDVVRKGGGYWAKRRALNKARARGLPVVLSEDIMVGPDHLKRLANWLALFPELARGAPPRVLRQSFKRRLRYFIRDMRSALGISGRAYR